MYSSKFTVRKYLVQKWWQRFKHNLFSSDILRMDSTNADALYVRGLCLYYEDCIDKAVQFFVQALRMAPDHEKARLACRVRFLTTFYED